MATNITEFSHRCRTDLPGCPIPIVNLAVVDAIVEFARDTHIFNYGFEMDVADTDVDETDNNAVTLDLSTLAGTPFSEKRPFEFKQFKIDGALFPTDHLVLSNDITNLENIRYGSTRYFSFPSDSSVKIWPMEVQDAVVYLHLVFKPLRTITDIDDEIFDDHHEAIEAYAKWILMRQSGKKWSNAAQSLVESNEYSQKMGAARAELTRGRTVDPVTVTPKYSFC